MALYWTQVAARELRAVVTTESRPHEAAWTGLHSKRLLLEHPDGFPDLLALNVLSALEFLQPVDELLVALNHFPHRLRRQAVARHHLKRGWLPFGHLSQTADMSDIVVLSQRR